MEVTKPSLETGSARLHPE